MSNQGPKWASIRKQAPGRLGPGLLLLFTLSQQQQRVTFSATIFFTHRQKEADHLGHRRKMKSQSSYAPPAYIPLGMSDSESAIVLRNEEPPKQQNSVDGPVQWSSGICACCDDMQSCCIGLFCPCFLFGKNAEFLGSGTFMGSCMTHFILWALVNTVCCLLTEGLVLGVPGCFVACYACGYRRTLRSKYNLQEAPCGDFVTHFFCHLCAICQEYREIREKSADSGFPDLSLAVVTAPPVQTMEPGLEE